MENSIKGHTVKKIIGNINKYIFFFLILVIISLPGLLLTKDFIKHIKEKNSIQNVWSNLNLPLFGVIVPPEKPKLSVKMLLDGTFQNGFGAYFAYKLTGRILMTRLYNQILFTVFKSSDSELLLGKNDHWIGRVPIQPYLSEPDSNWEKALKAKVKMLAELEKKLEEHDVKFYVLVYPGKASIYPECLPQAYQPYVVAKNKGEYKPDPYTLLKEYAYEEGVTFFENKELLLKEKEKGKIVFTKLSSHWSRPASVLFFNSAISFFNSTMDGKIGSIRIENESPVFGMSPWCDINDGNLLNIVFGLHDFESPEFILKVNQTDYRPNVFLCGDSFNWNLLTGLFSTEPFLFNHIDFSYYNSYVTRFPGSVRITDNTTNYESIMENDIIIIALLDSNISSNAAQFVFAENLLHYLKELDINSNKKSPPQSDGVLKISH
jgi:hypothetical protein